MKKYNIYWINQEIAQHLYHKGDILYRFLLEYIHSNDEHLISQYKYITNDIPRTDLTSFIKYKGILHNIHVKDTGEKLQLSDNKIKVELIINKQSLEISSQTLHCAEKVIFPILRSFQSVLFIVGESTNEYGWITPFNRHNQEMGKERLYSFK